MSDNQVFPLLSLPPEIWGLVYSKLGTKEDRRNFTHICKAIHDASDIKQRISKLVLKFPTPSTPTNTPPGQEHLPPEQQVAHFPGARIIRLEIRGLKESSHWLPFVTAAVHAATAAHATEELVIADCSWNYYAVMMDKEQLRDICTAAPQLRLLELDLTLEGFGDISPLQRLQNLRQLAVKRTRYSDCEGLQGVPDMLRSCTQLESLELPHSKLEGLIEGSTSPRVTVCCPSLKRLRILVVIADTLPDVEWMLDHVFPNVKQVEILCIQLLELHEDAEDPDSHYAVPGVFEATLERIRSGAGIFASGRVCLGEKKVLILLGTECLTYYSCACAGPAYRLMSLRALGALFLGGLSSDVRSLCLAHMYITSELISMCGRLFPNVQTLVFGAADYATDDGLFLASCIVSFGCLSRLTVPVCVKYTGSDAEGQLYSAVLVACHQAHMAARDVVLCVEGDGKISKEVKRALAWYEASVRASGGVLRVAMEEPDHIFVFDELRASQMI